MDIKAILLKKLGVTSTDDINNWFIKSYKDEYKLPGVEVCVSMLQAMDKEKPIHIFGDYDVDGIMASSITFMALKTYGFKHVKIRIPHRFSEGFGLKESMVDEIEDPSSTTIITVDNGIQAFEPIMKAKKLGCRVILTDHHRPAPPDENGVTNLPEADIIINPQAVPGATFTGYCGAGIAYKIARALLGDKAKGLMPLAAIATVADVMPLREENYVIVRNGLKLLTNGVAPAGIKWLLKLMNVEGEITSTDIGFKIAPALNAPGRLIDDGAVISVKAVLADTEEEAKNLAMKLVELNEERKMLVAEAMDNLPEIDPDTFPITLHLPDVGEGIIGIIAGKICEKYNGPALVFTDTENGIMKGSGRSIPGLDLKGTLDLCADCFLGYGGHEGAAGMSVKKEDFKHMKDELQGTLKGFKPDINDKVAYDIELKEEDVPKAYEIAKMFAPFGEGNEPLIVKVKGVNVLPSYGQYKHLVGKNGVKFYTDKFVCVGFDLADKVTAESPEVVTVIGTMSVNNYMGKSTLQIEMKDVEVEKEVSGTPAATSFAGSLSQISIF